MPNVLNVRIQLKKDSSENWDLMSTPPLDGEIIIYQDGEKNTNIKIGDGEHLPKDLPFASINELLFYQEIQKILKKFDDYVSIEDYIAGEGGTIELTGYLKKTEAEELYAPINILEQAYPIGAIYLSTVNINPSELFGFGTWEPIEERFLLGAGSTYAAGTTGGEINHTLTVEEMPAHSHTFSRHQFNNTEEDSGTDVYGVSNKQIPLFIDDTSIVGGGQAHNNMPPYLVVYMWKRVE